MLSNANSNYDYINSVVKTPSHKITLRNDILFAPKKKINKRKKYSLSSETEMKKQLIFT